MKKLRIIYALSGAGKTSLQKKISSLPGHENVISFTTRNQREGEIEGVDYYFKSIEEFDQNKMAAFIQIGSNVNWKYGVEKQEFDRIPETGVFSIISAQYVKDLRNYALSIGVDVEVIYLNVSREVRMERLLKRGEERTSIEARFDFEDKYSLEEVENIFPIKVINGALSEEEVLNEFLKGESHDK